MKALALSFLVAAVSAVVSTPSMAGQFKNYKTVMPGALYRGGNDTGERTPISSGGLKDLCSKGFSSAVYVYGRTGTDSVSCGGNNMSYKGINWKKEEAILPLVYRAIQNGSGPVYVHCWYGVHASGYIAAVALRQFCGYSAEQAVSYWNDHVPPSIRYPEVQKMIRDFRPNSSMQLSASQASKYCP